MFRITGLLALILLLGIAVTSPVAACSGGAGGSNLTDNLAQRDIVVSGSFVEVDDKGINGIFQVDRVLRGTNIPEFILIAQTGEPATEKNIQCGGYYRYKTGGVSVMFLNRLPDGTYLPYGDYPTFTFSDLDEQRYVWFGSLTDDQPRRLNETELLDWIATLTGQSSAAPLKSAGYPAKLPALITTLSGKHYLMPVDGGTPFLLSDEELTQRTLPQGCSTPPCTVRSIDGSNSASLYSPDDTISPAIYRLVFGGDAILFSSTGDAVAVWTNNALQIYTFAYRFIDIVVPSELVNMVSGNFEGVTGQAAWSSDGRMLAYSDSQGLWLWDALTTGSVPRLLVSRSEGVPVARYFSSMGRYLAVTIFQSGQASRFYIDLVSNRHYPDGLISPNERVLLAFDTTTAEFTPVYTPLTPAHHSESEIPYFFPTRQILWLADGEIIVAGCHNQTEEQGMPPCTVTSGGKSIPGYQFDYDAQGDQMITLVDSSTVTINGETHIIELDSAIVKVEWLSPVFAYKAQPVRLMAAGG